MTNKLLIILAMLLSVAGMHAQSWDGSTVAGSYAGGDGTKKNPFLISNGAELAKLAHDVNTERNFSQGRYFKLTNDIKLNENVMATDAATLQGGKAFPESPIIGTIASETEYTAFQGVFDGDGHTICGIYLWRMDGTNQLGLFRVTEDATIKNLGIEDSYVYGNSYCAAMAGRIISSQVINCHLSASRVGGYGSYHGALVGVALGSSKIQNCYTAGDIVGKNNVGAIVGRIGNGGTHEVLVENCYTTATITLNNRENKGGVTSENAPGSTVRNCFFTPASASTAVWADNGTTVGCQQKTEAEMQTDDFTALLNTNAKLIAGACRWTGGTALPTHNYAETTPDDENKREVSMLATNPQPANGDTHADAEGDSPQLSWTAARDGKTVKQYIYIGTDSTAIANATPTSATATLGSETSYTISGALSNMQTYYWRVDREDADERLTTGDVWMFQPRHTAFPGAEGYGRFARGGRGGKAVYVTNLNSEGPGSLRWALTNGQGPRTVLFNVSGVIDMEFKACWVDDQVTIAGQTAPGKGVCIKHSDIALGSDNICRFLRARRGLGTPDDTGNAIGTAYSDHTIMDHVTASWGTDETFSSRSSRNITFQRSIISEALGITGHRNYAEGTNHGYAATIGGDIGSFHHNLLANCNGRNWSMGGGANSNGEYAGRLDIFNNVVYNWNGRTTDGGAHEVNFVGNYYKMGPDTRETCLFTLEIEGNLKGTQSAYVSGNVRDNRNGTLTDDQQNNTYQLRIRDGRPSLDWTAFVSEPFWPSYAKMETARDCYKSVLSDVGANQPFSDLTDQRIVSETQNRSYTYTGSKSGIKGEIDDEEDAGGFEGYPATTWPDDYDTDHDGLPNWWEEIRGTNPRSRTLNYADTNSDREGDGYTELERYLDFMAQPHLLIAPGQTATVDVAALFAGYTKQPRYEADCVSTAVNATLSDNGKLTVTAVGEKAMATVALRVTDADNATYERRLCIAVTSYNATPMTGISPTGAHRVSTRQLYDVGGKAISRESTHGITIEKTTDGNGQRRVRKLQK